MKTWRESKGRAWSRLGQTSLVDPLAVVLAQLAAGLLLRYGVNTAWLILGGGLAGLLRALFL